MKDEEIIKNWNIYVELLKSTNRENIDKLIQFIDESDFKYAPASSKYYGVYRGGLLKHSLDVYYLMEDFKNFNKFFELSEESIKITALLHDICKINTYKDEVRNKKDENGNWIQVPYYIVDDVEPLGHAEKSIMYINEYGVQLSKIERAIIRNCRGFSEDEDRSRVSNLFKRCPQSLMLHWADEASTFITTNDDLPQKFRDKLVDKNITDSLARLEYNSNNKIKVGMTEYELVKEEDYNNMSEEERERKTCFVRYNGEDVIVYAPHNDGLPF